MKKILIFSGCVVLFFSGCRHQSEKGINPSGLSALCKDNCNKNKKQELTCKLTSPELQQRKATVLESLRKQIIGSKESENGYSFKFKGSDKMIDELTEFAKSERQCCDFFTFNISITGDTSIVTMEITGPKEAKEFIQGKRLTLNKLTKAKIIKLYGSYGSSDTLTKSEWIERYLKQYYNREYHLAC